MKRHLKRLRKKHFFVTFGLLVLAAIIGSGIFVVTTLAQLPSLTLLADREISESTKIYDRTGTRMLYELYGEEKRTVVPFDKIPESVKQATIAIEDSNFYNHSAVDFKGLMRAVLNNIGLLFGGDGIVQGGSTITQQLAKKAFLSDEQTPTRKLKELIIAYKLEQAFTKDQILELYLNQIPYGNNAYGIESAAQTYFQKSATDLTVPEAAALAAMPQAPSRYSPFGSHVKDLLARKDTVLERMYRAGNLTEAEKIAAQKTELAFSQSKTLGLATHFVIAIRDYLYGQYGEEFVRRAGLKVITTLDVKLQEAAEKAVAAGAERNTELYKGTNAALVAQDPKTGQILAMVGSRDYFDEEIDGQFNVATMGARQPGSALKPFVYLAALQAGYPEQTKLFDVETEFNTTNNPADSYKPQDYGSAFQGPINFRTSLAQSVNITAVKTLYLVGIENFLRLLESFGITTLSDRSRFGLSLVLGGGEVHLDELVGAYSILATEGVKHEEHMIMSVTDQKGRVLEAYKDTATPVADAEQVQTINDILADKDARAPLFQNSLGLTVFDGYDVALKTGTTNDYRDAWSVGYTPNLVAGVWAGNNDNKPMERRGGSILAAVPILSAFLRDALPNFPAETFNPPTPTYVNKPMLNGSSIAYYQVGSQLYPQIHNILYYVNKRNPLGPAPTNPAADPQFNNWEQGVLAWASSTIPGFQNGVTHNQPLPPGATLIEDAAPTQDGSGAQTGQDYQSGGIILAMPQAGSFISDNQIVIDATISSDRELARIEAYFNDIIIDTRAGNFGRNFRYQAQYSVGSSAQPQNTLKIVATDTTGAALTKSVVIYK